ncbi:uncharacterized protein PHALS_14283 [Plasmopara halstedii]|uniref:Uncharacterized protein n=1 Tax=Plasmopara halstedii TaxID=4781 RepID=A0A0P1ATH7_PLAHL|nr:uncharacterized protein PHALS_14283 [Plasmopara halstedii]CEG44010.1 hypothetical protein PHALS_14283 [Plasmopara halstedii]|eukprot:XP_024580379.1 hypothetical protein PHALS_14283 [Plasmopara halstedii]
MVELYLRLYPLFLGCSALGGFGFCQWFAATDTEIQGLLHHMSLKPLLTTVPQLLTALLLLYYACTFSRASSAFVHRMLVTSSLHKSITSLTLASFIFSAFHLSLSVCCSTPILCPFNPMGYQLDQIVSCPTSVANLNVFPRLVYSCVTYIMLLALASIEPAQITKDLNSRVHKANFITFSRREPIYDASPSVF